MTRNEQPLTDRPNPAVIAAQNDAFRTLACLGKPPEQPIQGRMHVTRSLIEAGDGVMAEAVKATGRSTGSGPRTTRRAGMISGRWIFKAKPCSGE